MSLTDILSSRVGESSVRAHVRRGLAPWSVEIAIESLGEPRFGLIVRTRVISAPVLKHRELLDPPLDYGRAA